ncbi:MAG: lysophospholipid acyltransferase family protein [Vicinamibacterales bacterium]|nr:lysophospholipid acyltransferase family protein [Vicinamibacterales bacterium]
MPDEPDWRTSRRKRVEVALIAAALAPLVGLLGRSYRWQCEGQAHLDAVTAAGQQPILALWHGRILPAVYFLRDRGIVAITSENYDGEWIARLMRRFGYRASRGSTSRGGARALRQLLGDVKGAPAAFTVDGPRGPSRVAQPGAVWLSKATGNPVLPFHIEAARGWELGSWDRTLVPRPFTRVAIVFGPPFVVPRDADAEGLEQARLQLERALVDCERRCRQVLSGAPTDKHEGHEGHEEK